MEQADADGARPLLGQGRAVASESESESESEVDGWQLDG